MGEERAAIGRAPPPLDVQGCRGETPCQLSITRLTSALLLLARKVGASAIGHGGGTAGCNPGRLARGTATDCLLPRPPALTFGVHGLGPGTHARPLGIITPISRPPTLPRRTGRVDVRNSLDQGTPCRIDGPSPRIYSGGNIINARRLHKIRLLSVIDIRHSARSSKVTLLIITDPDLQAPRPTDTIGVANSPTDTTFTPHGHYLHGVWIGKKS